jgi:hypothetical protein
MRICSESQDPSPVSVLKCSCHIWTPLLMNGIVTFLAIRRGTGLIHISKFPQRILGRTIFLDYFQVLLVFSSVSPGKLVRGVTLLRFLYTVGLLFESLSRYRFFLGLLSPSRHIPECYRKSGHWCYLSGPSQFITRHRPIIWRYIISVF